MKPLFNPGPTQNVVPSTTPRSKTYNLGPGVYSEFIKYVNSLLLSNKTVYTSTNWKNAQLRLLSTLTDTKDQLAVIKKAVETQATTLKYLIKVNRK